MRVGLDWAASDGAGTLIALTGITINSATTKTCRFHTTVAAGLTAGQASLFLANNTTNARLYLIAEL